MTPSTPILVLQWAFAAMVFSELVGYPIAWLKVRRSREWKNRPRDEWGFGMLQQLIGAYVGAAGIYGAVFGLTTWLGTKLA